VCFKIESRGISQIESLPHPNFFFSRTQPHLISLCVRREEVDVGIIYKIYSSYYFQKKSCGTKILSHLQFLLGTDLVDC